MRANSLPASPRVEFYRSEHIRVGSKSIQRHHTAVFTPQPSRSYFTSQDVNPSRTPPMQTKVKDHRRLVYP